MFDNRKAAMTFIFVTVVLDMIALGITAPVFTPLILQFTHGSYAAAALVSGITSTVFALVQFFASPVLGTLSDRVGRRPVVLLSNFGTFFDYLVLAVAPNLAWLYVARVVGGATTASITVASAYVADVTPPEKRAGAYGMISAAFGIGFIVGPALGGFFGAYGLRAPFWVAALLSLANFVYGAIVLPESLDREHRNAFSWARANPFGSLRMLRRHRELAGLSAVLAIVYVANQALPQLFVLYTMYAYAWGPKTLGLSLAFVGIVTFLVSAFVIKPSVGWLGDRRATIVGLFFGALGFVIYGGNQIAFFIAIAVNMISLIAGSASQAMMTRRVGKHEQGELQGAINMLRSFGMLFGPPIFTGIFAYSISDRHAWKYPSFGWDIAAALLFASMLLAFYVTRSDDDGKETAPVAQTATDAALEATTMG